MTTTAEYPTERYARDVAGMPAYAAVEDLWLFIAHESIAQSIPADDEHCAIAEGCRAQFQTPYVSVGRSRTDLALPHPNGVVKPGFGKTKWAVIRFDNPPSARALVIRADTDKSFRNEDGVMVKLTPPRRSTMPESKRMRNRRWRKTKRNPDGRGQGKRTNLGMDALTLAGVRNLSARRRP